MRWPKLPRRRRSHRSGTADAGMLALPPMVAEALLAIREREQLNQRRAVIPGAGLPEGAALRAARQAGLHPAVDPIGQRTRAALACWAQLIGGEVPETIAAWAGENTASILLAGPLDPAVGVPRERSKALGLEVSFGQYRRWRPDKPHQLVLATVKGSVVPGFTPDRAWAADGLLVPFGATRAGVLYLPLLGPSEAGPLALSGPAAPELLASLVVFALARVGAGDARALAYQDLLPHIEGLIDAEAFGPADVEPLRLRLEDEWKRRALQINAAHADDLHHYALLPDTDPIPLLVLLIGAQAATEMGLLDPAWPYVLRDAGRHGIPIIVWGDVATAPRRVHADHTGATFVQDASAEIIDYELPRIAFTPAVLPREVREEVAAVLRVRRSTPTPPGDSAPTEDTIELATATKDMAASRDAAVKHASVTTETAPRRLYLLGGVHAENAGAPVEGWRRRQALELLAFLAAHPEGRSSDAVSEAIWPDAHVRRARTHLRQLVREARVRLAGDPRMTPIVVLRDGIYRLDWQHVWADIEAFRRNLQEANQQADPEPYLAQAVGLYRGEFCKDAYYGWTEPIRYELERACLDAAMRLADLRSERGDLEGAHRTLDDALALNPYVDALVQRAMILDARRLGISAARERLQTFRKRLREELDVQPDRTTILVLEKLTRESSAD